MLIEIWAWLALAVLVGLLLWWAWLATHEGLGAPAAEAMESWDIWHEHEGFQRR